MAISGILIPLDGAAISAAILPVVASLARPIHASVHLFAAIDLQKRGIQSLCYTADGDASPVDILGAVFLHQLVEFASELTM